MASCDQLSTQIKNLEGEIANLSKKGIDVSQQITSLNHLRQKYKNQGCGPNLVQPLTNVAPATVVAGNFMFTFVTSLDGRVFYTKAQLFQGGTGWLEVPGNARTDTAPAASGAPKGDGGGHVFVIVKDLNGNLITNQADVNGDFNNFWN